MKKRKRCKVCNGAGFSGGIKCIYCINGYYICDVETEQTGHIEHDGEIIEFDLEEHRNPAEGN